MRTTTGETPLPIVVREGGNYVLRAIARDGAGRQTRTEVGFYALGPGRSYWRSEGNRRDQLVRQTWKPGDVARIRPVARRTEAFSSRLMRGIRIIEAVVISTDTVEVPTKPTSRTSRVGAARQRADFDRVACGRQRSGSAGLSRRLYDADCR